MCINKEKNSKSKIESARTTSPWQNKNPCFVSRVFFCWMLPLYYKGTQRDLDELDFVPVNRQYNSELVGDLLHRKWLKEQDAATAAGRSPSLIKVLVKNFWLDSVPGGIMQFLFLACKTATPMLFAKMLLYWSADSTMSRQTAIAYAACMIGMHWLSVIFNNHGSLSCLRFGMKLRIATSSLVYRKLLRLNNASLSDTAAGRVVNILSTDMHIFDLAMLYLHYIWVAPIQMTVVCYLCYLQAGFAGLFGLIALVVIAVPAQGILSHFIGIMRSRVAEKTDERVKAISEIIKGIQVIKMYAWELPFQKLLVAKRSKEIKQIKKVSLLKSLLAGFVVFGERAALFATIFTHILLGNTMSANIIYTLLQFINIINLTITLLCPLGMSYTTELRVSLRRVQDLLLLVDQPDLLNNLSKIPPSVLLRKLSPALENTDDAVKPLSYRSKSEFMFNQIGLEHASLLGPSLKPCPSVTQPGIENALELHNVSASWTGELNSCILKNLSLKIRRGQVCAIVGAVGSGKSSILQLLLKELPAASGSVSVHGNLSYCSQKSWLFSSTVRENIIFGLQYDSEKYNEVCKACCLEEDFKQFPFGDQSLVGERGVSLSGGQRARINLARSVYREADIYLLDDPLSAVDANVGRLLFEGCVNGYLRGRTRVLVTHQTHFLKAVDYIIVLNKGIVEYMGAPDEFVCSGKEISSMLASLLDSKDKGHVELGVITDEKGKTNSVTIPTKNEELNEYEAQKMQAEGRASGNLRLEVVVAYFRSGGNICFLLFAVGMTLLSIASAHASDYWVCYWLNNQDTYTTSLKGVNPDPGLGVQVGLFTTGQYLLIHGLLIVACMLIVNLRVLPIVELCLNASKTLHNRMLTTMIKGVMRFFDTNSSGRILNRFTKDMTTLDELLPRTLLFVLQILGILTGILVLNAIALYWTIFPSMILFFFIVVVTKIYLKTAQSVKRLEATTKSPVLNMVTSTIDGITTIRAAGAQERLINEFDKHQNLHTAAWNTLICGERCLGFYLDTLCLVYLSMVIFIFMNYDFGDMIPVGSVGMAVSQCSTLTGMMQYGARMVVDFIAQMTSVERVLDYTRIETEENLYENKTPLNSTWPSKGVIVFDNVSMRYAPGEAAVLTNVNFEIESGLKVGIVGRTGAGKSSLISALFRFTLIDGKITIDGLDTALVAKQELRSRISIIPQEPVLFSATIRYNLDPTTVHSDADLWKALEQVHMKLAVPSLDFKVMEGGANFSVGQRQLLCLARAVLRSNNILIMDEATANVDPQTDDLIQQTIREHFASCTVLTIAHRLNTVMDSDRVLVMSTGQVAEFDHPYILLSDPNSHLSSMVKETGEKSAAQLLQVAKDTSKARWNKTRDDYTYQ